MLDRLFRRKQGPSLPLSSSELSEALRAAAQYADGEPVKLEYRNAADALDRAVAHTRKHGDQPTRDALAYALGRAELNLQDQLRELIEVSKDTHMLVQGQGAAVVELRAVFLEAGEALSERMDRADDERRQISDRVEHIEAFLAARPAERAAEHQDIIDLFDRRFQAIEYWAGLRRDPPDNTNEAGG